ncbi:Integrator complex subunit 7 [Entomortierella chlamydospora]|uniref:Integrator complex subunit 7 n=1 Tax=Entomortierella chlamydospora TaxID=101097 RepID=A0A9P6N1T3_9FUNG|nr:Integrator complex subunit 7 [Entomortierella chlamydospora]
MAPSKSNASDEAGFKRLVELETEYRTQRSPDQLYAIASFPHLFDEFPYPVIINAGILKLADYFRQSNNIQRHAILQVFKKSQPHLKKVINVEETYKRISPMLQSNDPLARAITLRVLGGMATIVSDRIDVYHNVIHSLDSSEAMEVSAAVYAADMICAQSQRFCAIISGKLAFMVRDTLKTPLPLRRRLIRIFGHMFEDITLARLARKTCMDILELNQDVEYTVAILRTLTKLASHSLVDVNQQVDLLLQRAKASSNSEPGIRRVSLTCLGSLAQKNIEFKREQMQAIFDIALESEDEKTTLKAMVTLHKIFRLTNAMTSISLLESGIETMRGYIQVCIQILERSFSILPSTASPLSSASSVSKLVVLECYAVLAVILPYYRQLEAAGLTNVADSTFREAIGKTTESMEQFLLGIFSRGGKLHRDDTAQSRMVLSSLVSLTLEGGSGIDALLSTLLGWINTYKGRFINDVGQSAFTHYTAATTEVTTVPGCSDVLLRELRRSAQYPDISLLEFSALHHSPGSATTSSFESRVTALLEKFGRIDMLERYTRNHWDLYQIARYSLQTGWSSLALVALRNQEKVVSSVSSSLWLTTVRIVAQIESSLQTVTGGQKDSGQLNLCSQKQMYTKVISYLEELEAHQVNRTFHLQYSELRRQYLDACQSAVGILQLLSTSLDINREQQRSQHAWHTADEIALYRCADKFNELAHQYTLLRTVVSSSFASSGSDSLSAKTDQHSDGAIEVLQTMCLIIAYAIQRVAKILDYASTDGADSQINNSSGTETEIMDADVFDVDPLLIPLLYLQSQQQEQQEQMQHDGDSSSGSKTLLDIFKASTGLTLGYIDENLTGNGVDAVERGISIVRQLIQRYISYSIPIPQEFFVSMRSYAQEQPLSA